VSDEIVAATTPEDYAAFADMVQEYVEWCRRRYADDSWFVDAAFSHQSLEHELQALPISYGPPKGRTFLAKTDGEPIGCIAYRRLSDTICEMKRLYVRAGGQGRGTGRRLSMALIDAAREDGFELMRLDTANLLTEAIALYTSVGFRACPPYNEYPDALKSYIVFMDLPLGGASPDARTCADDRQP
jgi:GNAT superfamily N-acetyltransferase